MADLDTFPTWKTTKIPVFDQIITIYVTLDMILILIFTSIVIWMEIVKYYSDGEFSKDVEQQAGLFTV